jgi:hypothetical protein
MARSWGDGALSPPTDRLPRGSGPGQSVADLRGEAAIPVLGDGERLFASPTDTVARTPRREKLRFSKGADAAIEAAYRTHWAAPELSEKNRERLAEKASRAPELVVVQPLNSGNAIGVAARAIS